MTLNMLGIVNNSETINYQVTEAYKHCQYIQNKLNLHSKFLNDHLLNPLVSNIMYSCSAVCCLE